VAGGGPGPPPGSVALALTVTCQWISSRPCRGPGRRPGRCARAGAGARARVTSPRQPPAGPGLASAAAAAVHGTLPVLGPGVTLAPTDSVTLTGTERLSESRVTSPLPRHRRSRPAGDRDAGSEQILTPAEPRASGRSPGGRRGSSSRAGTGRPAMTEPRPGPSGGGPRAAAAASRDRQ
jgi:hypothetical protein